MIEKIMSKIKEKYDVTLNYRTENNILFFNGELKRVVVAGYVGEKAVTWDINLKFNIWSVIKNIFIYYFYLLTIFKILSYKFYNFF